MLHFKVALERRGLKHLTTDVAINLEVLLVSQQCSAQSTVMIHLLEHGLSYLARNPRHDLYLLCIHFKTNAC